MKKKNILLFALFLSILIPFQLMAQTSEVFRQEGIASWYGREFEGRPTASGEIFSSSQLTAAHPSLPFGTMLIVTNQHNNRSVTVRVNDRGPFVPARIIDISRAAAEQLDMIVTGTAPVTVVSTDRVHITTPAVGAQIAPQNSTPAAPQAAVQANTADVVLPQNPAVSLPAAFSGLRVVPQISITPERNYRFQVGSYRNSRNALDAFTRLRDSGLNPSYERFTNENNVDFFRVVVSGVSGTDFNSTAALISAAGFREALIREEN